MLAKRRPVAHSPPSQVQANPLTGELYSYRYYQLRHACRQLPFWSQADAVAESVRQEQVTLVKGETGSGKSTQVCHLLLEQGLDKRQPICVANSRDLFLKNLAKRVSLELDVSLGFEVGYSLELDAKKNDKTKFLMVNYEILLKESLECDISKKYSVFVLDDVHERDMYFELFVVLLNKLLKENSDMRVIMLTSMMETAYFETLFPKVSIVQLPGVLNTVEVHYLPSEVVYKQAMQLAMETIISLVLFEEPGNILAFLSSDQDFNHYLTCLKQGLEIFYEQLGPVAVTFIYSDYVSPIFSKEQQMLNVKGSAKPPRVVYLIASACEFHLINDIRFVVDCGWEMRKAWDPRLRHSVNRPTLVSRFEVDNRGLTAGTVDGGKCFRMYTRATYLDSMPTSKPSDLVYKDLAKADLLCRLLGLDWQPFADSGDLNKEILASCRQYLAAAQLISEEEEGKGQTSLSQYASFVCSLPLPVSLGKAVLEATKQACCMKIVDLVAVLSCPGIFPRDPTYHLDDRELREAKCERSAQDGEQHQLLRALSTGQERMLMIRLLHCLEDYEKVKDQKLKWCLAHNLAFRYLEKAIMVRDCLKYCILTSKFEQKQSGADVQVTNSTDAILGCLLQGLFRQVAVKIDDDKYVLSSDEVAVDPVGPTSVIPLRSFVVYCELFRDSDGLEVNLLQPVAAALLEGRQVFADGKAYMEQDPDLDARDYFKSVKIETLL